LLRRSDADEIDERWYVLLVLRSTTAIEKPVPFKPASLRARRLYGEFRRFINIWTFLSNFKGFLSNSDKGKHSTNSDSMAHDFFGFEFINLFVDLYEFLRLF
jgi:hypothetical protein